MVPHDETDERSGTNRDATTQGRGGLTTRGFLGGSATAVTGSVAGCLDRNDEPTTPGHQTTPGHEGSESLTVERLTTAQHNTTVYASEYETINDAVEAARDGTEGPITVVLPPGTTRYTETIRESDRSVVVRGQGMNESTLEADGAERLLVADYDADARQTVVLEGFTLDQMQVPGKGRAFVMEGGHTMIVRDVRITEINIEERDAQFGLVRGIDLERLYFADNEVRFDTLTNRAGAGDRDKIRVIQAPSPTKQFVAERNRLVGERLPIEERPEYNFMNGFRVDIAAGGTATVRDNVFENWDQYATFIGVGTGATAYVVNNVLPNAGDADLIRAHAREDGGRVVIHGNTIRKGDELTGDRGIIPQSMTDAVAHSIYITDNYVEGVMVPVEVNNGARNIVVANNTFRNCGHPRRTHDAILIRSSVGGSDQELMRNARVANNLIDNTDSDRSLGTLARFQGTTWEGYAVVEHNIADGIVADTIEDAVSTNWGESDVELVVRDNLLTSVELDYDVDIPDYEVQGTIPRQELSIDGDISEVTDTEPHVSLGDGIHVVEPGEGGMETFNAADFWFRYDESAVYLVARIEDDVHYQPNTEGSFYDADCIQFGISQGPPGATPNWNELDIALTPEGPRVFRRTFPQGPEGLLEDGATFEAVRDEDAGTTIYEVRIEWDVLEADFEDAGLYSLDLAGTNHDGDGSREGLWQWGGENIGDDSAIFGSKETVDLKAMELV